MKLGWNQLLFALLGYIINHLSFILYLTRNPDNWFLACIIIYTLFSILLTRILKKLALPTNKTLELQILWNINLTLFLLSLIISNGPLIMLALILVNGGYFISQQFLNRKP